MDRFDPFVKYADVYGDVINWEKDPMNKPQNQNKYFFSDGKTYYEQICKMLRLMSVFKQAFNQIYDNEDEIHSAWENFVDNLSATAVYGEEVGVNLTWTDTSVNFAFTIPGGEDGVGIQSITFNSDYTMTITLTDGQTYTSDSLRGPQGEQGIQGIQGPAGPQGEPGSGLEILDVYPTLQDLQTAHPTGSPGDAYQVGTAPSYTLYIWSASQSAWVPAGTIGSSVPSSADPLMDGTASAGISDLYARGDHVHPTDTSRASVQDLEAVDDKVDETDDRVDDLNDFINTSQKLIDQSFVYRESPAEHDGLAVLDKIKGHTVKFNQLVNYGETQTSGTNYSITDNNDGSFTITLLQPVSANTTINVIVSSMKFYANEKYLATTGVLLPEGLRGGIGGFGTTAFNPTSKWQEIQNPSNFSSTSFRFVIQTTATFSSWTFYPLLFNLTEMFGEGNEPATPEAFESWLSQNLGLLDYYAYTPGTLISFNGTGLKTTGKNLLPVRTTTTITSGITCTPNGDGTFTLNGTATGIADLYIGYTNIVLMPLGLITDGCLLSGIQGGSNSTYQLIAGSTSSRYATCENGSVPLTNVLQDGIRVLIRVFTGTTLNNLIVKPMITFPDADQSYEPYTESTLSLEALNTLFPTGMNNVDTVYDELTSTKATRRFGKVTTDDFVETVSEDVSSGGLHWMELNNSSIKINGKAVCNLLPVDNATAWLSTTPVVQIGTSTNRTRVYGTFTTLAEFKSQYPNLEICYELATPIEQDIDLDLSFKAYQDGTEQLLPVNGSIPTTSSLLADITYFSINDAMEYILAKLDQISSSIASDINSLKTRMTSAEGDIADLDIDLTAVEENLDEARQTLRRLRGKTVFENLAETEQGVTTANISTTDLENATHIEVVYTTTLTSNMLSTGLIPWKLLHPASVEFSVTLAEAQLEQYCLRSLGISTEGVLTINSCQMQYSGGQMTSNSKLIVRQVNLYRITKSNDIS